MDDKIVVGNDEFVAVFLGKDQEPNSEFAQHPRVQWIYADSKVEPSAVVQSIPPKSRAFLLTEGIPAAVYQQLTAEARRQHVTYLHRKNPRAVRGTLYELFPKTNGTGNGSSIEGQGRGFLKKFLDEHPPDLAKGSADEARRLQLLAREAGVVTTFGSLAQAIAVMKRKGGRGDLPVSFRKAKQSKEDEVLQTLDDAIAGLQLLRAWVAEQAETMASLKAQLASVRAALGMP